MGNVEAKRVPKETEGKTRYETRLIPRYKKRQRQETRSKRESEADADAKARWR